MSSKPTSPILQAWYKWKSLRLPWRRRILRGLDLHGNTYWEFRIAGVPEKSRLRRMVHYPRSTHHSDVKVPPLWHQWLRYMREEPPSLDEQKGDVARQARLKILAAEADRRWEAKPKVMDAEETRRLAGQQETVAAGGEDAEAPVSKIDNLGTKLEGQEEQTRRKGPAVEKGPEEEGRAKTEDPWARARARGPSEDWQPDVWKPPQPAERT